MAPWQGSHSDDDDDEGADDEGDRAPESSQGVAASRESRDVDGSGGDPHEDLEFDTDPSSGDGEESD